VRSMSNAIGAILIALLAAAPVMAAPRADWELQYWQVGDHTSLPVYGVDARWYVDQPLSIHLNALWAADHATIPASGHYNSVYVADYIFEVGWDALHVGRNDLRLFAGYAGNDLAQEAHSWQGVRVGTDVVLPMGDITLQGSFGQYLHPVICIDGCPNSPVGGVGVWGGAAQDYQVSLRYTTTHQQLYEVGYRWSNVTLPDGQAGTFAGPFVGLGYEF